VVYYIRLATQQETLMSVELSTEAARENKEKRAMELREEALQLARWYPSAATRVATEGVEWSNQARQLTQNVAEYIGSSCEDDGMANVLTAPQKGGRRQHCTYHLILGHPLWWGWIGTMLEQPRGEGEFLTEIHHAFFSTRRDTRSQRTAA
jgi:hypothetical protein